MGQGGPLELSFPRCPALCRRNKAEGFLKLLGGDLAKQLNREPGGLLRVQSACPAHPLLQCDGDVPSCRLAHRSVWTVIIVSLAREPPEGSVEPRQRPQRAVGPDGWTRETSPSGGPTALTWGSTSQGRCAESAKRPGRGAPVPSPECWQVEQHPGGPGHQA